MPQLYELTPTSLNAQPGEYAVPFGADLLTRVEKDASGIGAIACVTRLSSTNDDVFTGLPAEDKFHPGGEAFRSETEADVLSIN